MPILILEAIGIGLMVAMCVLAAINPGWSPLYLERGPKKRGGLIIE